MEVGLASLRQSFLNGSLTRLIDPDAVLRGKILEFVGRGDFGLASGPRADGTYERLWFQDLLPPDEVVFEPGVFLLTKVTAERLRAGVSTTGTAEPASTPEAPAVTPVLPDIARPPHAATRALRVTGNVPPEVWNRLGTRILPRLRAGTGLEISVGFTVTVSAATADTFSGELRQILHELGLAGAVTIE